MSCIPANMLAVRRSVAGRFLAGQGIEIGALHEPLELPQGAAVKYVDRLPIPELRKQYPSLKDATFHVDVVDDGEKLTQFAPASLDFIVANHFLEHCENPLGTIRSHLAKVKPGGVLYYAVPDRDCGPDAGRPVTTWQHLVDDDRLGAERSRAEHYLEFVRTVRKDLTGVQAEKLAKASMRDGYSIHFHVWDEAAFGEFVKNAKAYVEQQFEVEHRQRNQNEFIVVLRRVRD